MANIILCRIDLFDTFYKRTKKNVEQIKQNFETETMHYSHGFATRFDKACVIALNYKSVTCT